MRQRVFLGLCLALLLCCHHAVGVSTEMKLGASTRSKLREMITSRRLAATPNHEQIEAMRALNEVPDGSPVDTDVAFLETSTQVQTHMQAKVAVIDDIMLGVLLTNVVMSIVSAAIDYKTKKLQEHIAQEVTELIEGYQHRQDVLQGKIEAIAKKFRELLPSAEDPSFWHVVDDTINPHTISNAMNKAMELFAADIKTKNPDLQKVAIDNANVFSGMQRRAFKEENEGLLDKVAQAAKGSRFGIYLTNLKKALIAETGLGISVASGIYSTVDGATKFSTGALVSNALSCVFGFASLVYNLYSIRASWQEYTKAQRNAEIRKTVLHLELHRNRLNLDANTCQVAANFYNLVTELARPHTPIVMERSEATKYKHIVVNARTLLTKIQDFWMEHCSPVMGYVPKDSYKDRIDFEKGMSLTEIEDQSMDALYLNDVVAVALGPRDVDDFTELFPEHYPDHKHEVDIPASCAEAEQYIDYPTLSNGVGETGTFEDAMKKTRYGAFELVTGIRGPDGKIVFNRENGELNVRLNLKGEVEKGPNDEPYETHVQSQAIYILRRKDAAPAYKLLSPITDVRLAYGLHMRDEFLGKGYVNALQFRPQLRKTKVVRAAAGPRPKAPKDKDREVKVKGDKATVRSTIETRPFTLTEFCYRAVKDKSFPSHMILAHQLNSPYSVNPVLSLGKELRQKKMLFFFNTQADATDVAKRKEKMTANRVYLMISRQSLPAKVTNIQVVRGMRAPPYSHCKLDPHTMIPSDEPVAVELPRDGSPMPRVHHCKAMPMGQTLDFRASKDTQKLGNPESNLYLWVEHKRVDLSCPVDGNAQLPASFCLTPFAGKDAWHAANPVFPISELSAQDMREYRKTKEAFKTEVDELEKKLTRLKRDIAKLKKALELATANLEAGKVRVVDKQKLLDSHVAMMKAKDPKKPPVPSSVHLKQLKDRAQLEADVRVAEAKVFDLERDHKAAKDAYKAARIAFERSEDEVEKRKEEIEKELQDSDPRRLALEKALDQVYPRRHERTKALPLIPPVPVPEPAPARPRRVRNVAAGNAAPRVAQMAPLPPQRQQPEAAPPLRRVDHVRTPGGFAPPRD